MKITIITLTKNNCPTLERSLLSLIDQTHKDWEHIIVDACWEVHNFTQIGIHISFSRLMPNL